MHKKWKGVGLLVGAVLVLLAVAVFFLTVPVPQAKEASSVTRQQPSPVQDETQASATSATTDDPDLAGSLDVKVRPVDVAAAQPRTTNEDLLAKGFPMMSAPRKAAYTETAEQNTKELVADLGNVFIFFYCRQNQNTWPDPRNLAYWSGAIPPNIKVLRLIEEGRKAPDAIAGLLRESVKSCLSTYDYVREERVREEARLKAGERPNGLLSENDPYYKEHRTYEAPSYEFDRLNAVVYMDFYTLANIGRLGPPQLLDDWFEKDKPWVYQATDFDVWLIDCYFKQAASEAPPDEGGYAAKHAALVGEAKISGSRVVESRWNAPWDIHDWMLGAKQVNLSDIETIDVLEIPQSIPLDDDVKQQIIQNFLGYAGQTK